MPQVRSGLRQWLAAGAIAVATALPASAQITLDANGLRKAAILLLDSGQSARAQLYAEALIKRDQDDIGAHLILARALRDQGQLPQAREAARTAWRLADTDAKRYSAATVNAQVLSSMGKRTRAQLWLRRASQHASTPQQKARARRDFGYVRQQNPWSTQLSFTLAPNSNINNGSAHDRSFLNYALSDALFGEPVEFQLTGAARALSGLEFGASVQSRYRFHQTPTTAHDLKFTASYRSFALSGSSKNAAPDVTGSDFSFGTLGVGYGYRRLNFDRKGEFAFDLSAAQSWYGNARYASFLRGTLAQTYRPSRTKSLRFAFDVEQQNGQRTTDTQTYKASASLNTRLASGNSAFVKFGLGTTTSNTADAAFDEIELRGGYVLGKPVMGAVLQFGLGASLRDYAVSPHSADGREDFKISADVTATFTKIDYYGFNPSVSLNASTTDSNIRLFDSNRIGISIGIRSAF